MFRKLGVKIKDKNAVYGMLLITDNSIHVNILQKQIPLPSTLLQ